MDEREETPMMEAPAHGVLGTLWLIAKKTGVDMQSFPIDADRVTIGRDWDSDIRLYFSDVSKLHCEIKFDQYTGEASIHVHGTHGVKHAPQSGELTTYKPPAVIPLSDKDTFLVRKKLFRFEYGHQDMLIDTPPTQTQALPSDSPVKSASPVPAQRRKRVSHRMSLVPSGKSFEPFASPIKSRRHSIIGLGDGPQVVRTPKKSGLSRQIEEVEEEEQPVAEEEEEVVVEAVEGEEGDVLYFESREEEAMTKPVHDNPFMTPQQKRKAPMRNTSAVPRTRKIEFAVSQSASQEPEVQVDGTASPRTPRSVPLPPSSETPYGSVVNSPTEPVKTPRSIPLPPADTTPYVVSAQVAMSTPKGPVSLHKALLLRSARKAWQSSQAKGVDGAIQNGSVTTKRKSLSPSTKARKSLSPAPIVEEAQDEEEASEEEAEEADVEEAGEEQEGQGELQWVYEDGTAAQSFDESDSSLDSLDADQSLDIPGQGIISFDSPHGPAQNVEDEEEAMNQYQDESMEDVVEDEDSYDAQEMEEAYINEQGALQEVDGEDEEFVEEDDEFQDEPEQPYRPLERFFTPQPRRTLGATGPRRSLASISGPPTRLVPVTPVSGFRRMPGTPGTLGLPSRRVAAPVEEVEEEEEEKAAPVPSTPIRREVSAALLAEAKRRRETLGTPRALPTLPPSFKTPNREVSLRNVVKTPSHPALAPHTPEADIDGGGSKPMVPLTPMEKVQKKIDALRRQSEHRIELSHNRRATVSFALPSTPARPQPHASASYTVVGQRRTFAMTKEEDEEASEPGTPVLAGRDAGDISSLKASPQPAQYAEKNAEGEDAEDEFEEKEERAAGPSTPLFTGMKEMFRSAPPPKTPIFAGVRSMFANTPKAAPTPHYNCMKTMFHQNQEPATPHMNGMKEMFHLAQQPVTPDMQGLDEMYELEEVEQEAALASETESEEEEMVEARSEIIAISPPPRSPPRVKVKSAASTTATKKTTAATSRIQAPVASSSKASAAQPTRATASKVPVAKTASRSKAAASAPVVEKKIASASAPARKAAAAPRARAATKAAARPRAGDIDDISISEIDEPVEYYETVKPKVDAPKPKTLVRPTTSRAKKVEAVKPEEPVPAKEAPANASTSRGKKAVLGENEEQAQAAAPAPAKATRARKAVDKSASSSTSTASATAPKAASTSVPARKSATRAAKVEKENEPEVEKPEVAAVKKAPVRKAVKKAEVVAEPVVTTRATRSRK